MKYIHIGYPKNLSTTLQRDFFEKHPQLLHLGVGCGSNIDYIDHNINIICEDYLQYCRDIRYEEKKEFVKNSFDKWFQYFQEHDNYKAVGISLELLSFTFTPDQIDITSKVERVAEIFGVNTKIIVIIRNQKELLKSLYRESIKLGYCGNFQDFLKYCYQYQDRNFLYDFLYDKTIALYQKYFNKNDFCIIPIEDTRNPDGKLKMDGNNYYLIKKLSDFLNVEYYHINLGHYNAPLNEQDINFMIKENIRNPHNLSNTVYSGGANLHRLKFYYNEELKMNLEESEIFRDVIIKNRNRKEAEQLAQQNDTKYQVDYSFNSYFGEELLKLFTESNKKLEKMINIELPQNYVLI